MQRRIFCFSTVESPAVELSSTVPSVKKRRRAAAAQDTPVVKGGLHWLKQSWICPGFLPRSELAGLVFYFRCFGARLDHCICDCKRGRCVRQYAVPWCWCQVTHCKHRDVGQLSAVVIVGNYCVTVCAQKIDLVSLQDVKTVLQIVMRFLLLATLRLLYRICWVLIWTVWVCVFSCCHGHSCDSANCYSGNNCYSYHLTPFSYSGCSKSEVSWIYSVHCLFMLIVPPVCNVSSPAPGLA